MNLKLPRHLENLISPIDWACIEGEAGDETDWEAYILAGEYTDEGPAPEAWALEVITAQPGVWVAELCRIKHDLDSTTQNVAFCGLCREYANPRKRLRAAALGPLLPGFSSGAYQLHDPCSNQALTWLRKLTYRLEKAGFLLRKREQIPDPRQARGWDWGTRLYRKE